MALIQADECRIHKGGPGLVVDRQVRVNGNLTIFHGNDIAEEVAARLKASELGVTDLMAHVEPAGSDGALLSLNAQHAISPATSPTGDCPGKQPGSD